MSSSADLENAALSFLETTELESFTAEDPFFEKVIPETLPEKEREKELAKLENIFDSLAGVARRHGDETFYVLKNFFRGSIFLCRPRKFEIEEGILVPGCRFEPFHPAELYVNELEIALDGKRAETKEFRTTYGEVADLFFLLGPAGTMDMLTAESQLNYESIRDREGLHGDMPLELEVFDFAEFYRKNGFLEGDYLKFEITSWADGAFRCSVVRRSDYPSPADVKAFLHSFEDSLAKVCTEYRDSFEIPEQITYAYIYAALNRRTDLRKQTGLPLDLYHTQMEDISFRRDGAEWTLASGNDDEDGDEEACSCTHDHEDGDEDGDEEACSCGHHHRKEISFDDFSVSKGTLDSLDAILKDVHSPVCETEIHAMMLDALANSADSFEEFARTYGKYVELKFTDEAQEAAFFNYAEELWELTSEHYGFNQDSLKAPLRSRLLELTDRRVELSSLILESGKEFPTEMKEEIRKIHADILHTLAILGLDAVLEESQIGDLDLRIGDIEDDFDLLADHVSEWLEQKSEK